MVELIKTTTKILHVRGRTYTKDSKITVKNLDELPFWHSRGFVEIETQIKEKPPTKPKEISSKKDIVIPIQVDDKEVGGTKDKKDEEMDDKPKKRKKYRYNKSYKKEEDNDQDLKEE